MAGFALEKHFVRNSIIPRQHLSPGRIPFIHLAVSNIIPVVVLSPALNHGLAESDVNPASVRFPGLAFRYTM